MALGAWLGRQSSWISPLLILGTMIALALAWNCTAVPASEIVEVECYATYIGPLETAIGRRGISGGAIGVGNGIDCTAPGSRSGYTPFSKVLNLGDGDLEDIRRGGVPYRIGFHAGAVVTISGAERRLIDYQGYVARAAYLRSLFIAAAVAAVLLAVGIRFLDRDKESGGESR